MHQQPPTVSPHSDSGEPPRLAWPTGCTSRVQAGTPGMKDCPAWMAVDCMVATRITATVARGHIQDRSRRMSRSSGNTNTTSHGVICRGSSDGSRLVFIPARSPASAIPAIFVTPTSIKNRLDLLIKPFGPCAAWRCELQNFTNRTPNNPILPNA
jgi:hypothetical protein